MIVISDTGPLHYLFLIGRLDLLPALFGRVIVPRSVVSKELNDDATPELLRTFFRTPPLWLSVHDGPASVDPSLSALGLGERDAISLMLELRGDLLLCDDVAARKRAAHLGVSFVGTLGLIDEAAFRGLIDFEEAIGRLTQTTNFHHTSPLINRVREQHRLRLANPRGKTSPDASSSGN